MLVTNEYLMGFRDDKESRFHDIVEVGKAQSAANAAILYSGTNPALAEALMGMIKFQWECGRKEYEAHLQAGASEATLKSLSGRNKVIEHIHRNCYEEIVSSWEPLTIEETNEQLLEDLRKKASPDEAKKIDLLLDSIEGRAAQNPTLEEWLNANQFTLHLL